ncbi:MAG TPA: 50S ribosomal protein L11 methyltransferase [Gammaproteobacteria bacterium]
MSRQRLTLELAAQDVATAEALLTLAGAETISLRDAADDAVFEPEPGTTPLWPNVVLEALFAEAVDVEALLRLLATTFPGVAATVEPFDESAWATKLARPVKARAIGARLWLAPAADSDVPNDRLVVRVNMGLAFGTGEHATTALCLEWLERHIASGTTVLDYGCGSGILALAALALGARFAYAVDNDPQALTATSANAAVNGVAERLFVGAPETLPAVAVDVLVANILAGPLIDLAPVFAGRVVPGGMVVLSGVLDAQAARVAAAYAPYLENVEHVSRDGWARLAGSRKAG